MAKKLSEINLAHDIDLEDFEKSMEGREAQILWKNQFGALTREHLADVDPSTTKADVRKFVDERIGSMDPTLGKEGADKLAATIRSVLSKRGNKNLGRGASSRRGAGESKAQSRALEQAANVDLAADFVGRYGHEIPGAEKPERTRSSTVSPEFTEQERALLQQHGHAHDGSWTVVRQVPNRTRQEYDALADPGRARTTNAEVQGGWTTGQVHQMITQQGIPQVTGDMPSGPFADEPGGVAGSDIYAVRRRVRVGPDGTLQPYNEVFRAVRKRTKAEKGEQALGPLVGPGDPNAVLGEDVAGSENLGLPATPTGHYVEPVASLHEPLMYQEKYPEASIASRLSKESEEYTKAITAEHQAAERFRSLTQPAGGGPEESGYSEFSQQAADFMNFPSNTRLETGEVAAGYGRHLFGQDFANSLADFAENQTNFLEGDPSMPQFSDIRRPPSGNDPAEMEQYAGHLQEFDQGLRSLAGQARGHINRSLQQAAGMPESEDGGPVDVHSDIHAALSDHILKNGVHGNAGTDASLYMPGYPIHYKVAFPPTTDDEGNTRRDPVITGMYQRRPRLDENGAAIKDENGEYQMETVPVAPPKMKSFGPKAGLYGVAQGQPEMVPGSASDSGFSDKSDRTDVMFVMDAASTKSPVASVVRKMNSINALITSQKEQAREARDSLVDAQRAKNVSASEYARSLRTFAALRGVGDWDEKGEYSGTRSEVGAPIALSTGHNLPKKSLVESVYGSDPKPGGGQGPQGRPSREVSVGETGALDALNETAEPDEALAQQADADIASPQDYGYQVEGEPGSGEIVGQAVQSTSAPALSPRRSNAQLAMAFTPDEDKEGLTKAIDTIRTLVENKTSPGAPAPISESPAVTVRKPLGGERTLGKQFQGQLADLGGGRTQITTYEDSRNRSGGSATPAHQLLSEMLARQAGTDTPKSEPVEVTPESASSAAEEVLRRSRLSAGAAGKHQAEEEAREPEGVEEPGIELGSFGQGPAGSRALMGIPRERLDPSGDQARLEAEDERASNQRAQILSDLQKHLPKLIPHLRRNKQSFQENIGSERPWESNNPHSSAVRSLLFKAKTPEQAAWALGLSKKKTFESLPSHVQQAVRALHGSNSTSEVGHSMMGISNGSMIVTSRGQGDTESRQGRPVAYDPATDLAYREGREAEFSVAQDQSPEAFQRLVGETGYGSGTRSPSQGGSIGMVSAKDLDQMMGDAQSAKASADSIRSRIANLEGMRDQYLNLRQKAPHKLAKPDGSMKTVLEFINENAGKMGEARDVARQQEYDRSVASLTAEGLKGAIQQHNTERRTLANKRDISQTEAEAYERMADQHSVKLAASLHALANHPHLQNVANAAGTTPVNFAAEHVIGGDPNEPGHLSRLLGMSQARKEALLDKKAQSEAEGSGIAFTEEDAKELADHESLPTLVQDVRDTHSKMWSASKLAAQHRTKAERLDKQLRSKPEVDPSNPTSVAQFQEKWAKTVVRDRDLRLGVTGRPISEVPLPASTSSRQSDIHQEHFEALDAHIDEIKRRATALTSAYSPTLSKDWRESKEALHDIVREQLFNDPGMYHPGKSLDEIVKHVQSNDPEMHAEAVAATGGDQTQYVRKLNELEFQKRHPVETHPHLYTPDASGTPAFNFQRVRVERTEPVLPDVDYGFGSEEPSPTALPGDTRLRGTFKAHAERPVSSSTRQQLRDTGRAALQHASELANDIAERTVAQAQRNIRSRRAAERVPQGNQTQTAGAVAESENKAVAKYAGDKRQWDQDKADFEERAAQPDAVTAVTDTGAAASIPLSEVRARSRGRRGGVNPRQGGAAEAPSMPQPEFTTPEPVRPETPVGDALAKADETQATPPGKSTEPVAVKRVTPMGPRRPEGPTTEELEQVRPKIKPLNAPATASERTPMSSEAAMEMAAEHSRLKQAVVQASTSQAGYRGTDEAVAALRKHESSIQALHPDDRNKVLAHISGGKELPASPKSVKATAQMIGQIERLERDEENPTPVNERISASGGPAARVARAVRTDVGRRMARASVGLETGSTVDVPFPDATEIMRPYLQARQFGLKAADIAPKGVPLRTGLARSVSRARDEVVGRTSEQRAAGVTREMARGLGGQMPEPASVPETSFSATEEAPASTPATTAESGEGRRPPNLGAQFSSR